MTPNNRDCQENTSAKRLGRHCELAPLADRPYFLRRGPFTSVVGNIPHTRQRRVPIQQADISKYAGQKGKRVRRPKA